MLYQKLSNTSLNALLCAILMVFFSAVPQNLKLLQEVFTNIEQVAEEGSATKKSDRQSQDSNNQASTPTIAEEELIHHQLEILSFISSFNINRYSFTNEFCQGIAPDTSLPPPDRQA